MASQLHPEVAEFLESMDEQGIPPAYVLTPDSAREVYRNTITADKPDLPVGNVRDLEIPGPNGPIPLRVYEPADPSEAPDVPVVFYVHGGGFVRGDIETYDHTCRELTREIGCLTVSIDYHRAPEHPFPAPVLDAFTGAKWVAEHADVFGGDTDRLAIAGDSAGGNLATVVTQMARDIEHIPIEYQVLLTPITNYGFDTDSYHEHADNPILPRRAMQWFWNHYLSNEIDGYHPYASPLRSNDLSDLPPATVITAEHDPVRDEGVAYADRLREAGVPVTRHHYEDMVHGFVTFSQFERAGEAQQQVAEQLREVFGIGG